MIASLRIIIGFNALRIDCQRDPVESDMHQDHLCEHNRFAFPACPNTVQLLSCLMSAMAFSALSWK